MPGPALARDPHDPTALVTLGNGLRALERHGEAVEAFHAALAVQPSRAATHNDLGLALAEFGAAEEARTSYRRAIALDPGATSAHRNLSALITYRPGDPHISEMERLVADPDLPAAAHTDLQFALGKAFDDLDVPARAFPHFAQGNALRRAAQPFSISAERAAFRRIAAAWRRRWRR